MNDNSRIEERLDKMNETLIRNTMSLEEHMRRSAAIEQAVELQGKMIDARMKPVEEHVKFLNNAAKLAAVIGAVVTFFVTVIDKLANFVSI